MIQVTDRAKQELSIKLSAVGVHKQYEGIRLVTKDDRFALRKGLEMPGDQVVRYKGARVLLVGKGLAANLEGRTLDFQDTTEGRRFVVLKPSKRR